MKVKFFLIGFIGLIVVTEIVLRLFYSEGLAFPFRPAVYLPLPVVNYGYVPDTTFTLSGKNHYINKQGFIGDDFGEKAEDTFRIAIVGASTVAGSINLKAYYSFCPQLQQKFIDSKSKVEILNCGIDGNERSLELFKSIRHQVTGFNPDMILLEYDLPLYSSNVIRENYRGYIIGYPALDEKGREYCKQMVDKVVAHKKIIDLLYHSYITRTLVRIYYKKSKSKFRWYISLYRSKIFVYGKFVPIQYTMEESTQMIQDLKNELNEAGVKFFLFQSGRDHMIIQTAKEYELPLISLGVSFTESDYFSKDGHWNEQGCQKIADRFYDLIIKHKLIPEKY